MHAAHRSRLAALFLLLITLSACDAVRFWDAPEPVANMSTADSEVLDVRKEATLIQSSIGKMDRQDLPTFDLGDTQLDVSLYFDAGRLRLVDERIRTDNESYSRNRYYYNDEALFFFYSKADIRLNPGERPAEYADGLTRMYFNKKGNMFDYEKSVNGLETNMQEGELAGVMRRAFALRELDWDRTSGVVDTTAFLAVINTVDELEKGLLGSADPGDETASPEMDMEGEAITEDTEAAAVPSEQAAPAPTSTTRKITQSQTSRESAPPPTEHATPSRSQTSRQSAPPPSGARTSSPPPAVVPADEVLIEPHTHAMLPGKLSSHRIRFQKGYTGATLSASVRTRSHKEYVLRAQRGQRMSATLSTDSPDVFFRVFLDDGDISGRRRNWSGTLPRTADYHIVVYVRLDAKRGTEAGYTISMSIE